MRALVAGAAGQLGRELISALGAEVAWSGGRADLDVTDGEAVLATVRRVRPDVILNAAAYNKVDAAEAETARALEVNALAPRLLARAASEVSALLVHFSTDYVFDGASDRPYREEDPPRPLNAYGVSKLAGEGFVTASGCQALIVRTSAVFGRGGSRQKGGSFIERIVEQARAGRPLRVVSDQVFSPTYAPDLTHAVVDLVRAGARGLCHVTGDGSCTWCELAEAALAAAGQAVSVTPVSSRELGLAASRPAYSVLDNGRCRGLGLPPLRHWREAVVESLATRSPPEV